MITLLFLATLAAIFISVVLSESEGEAAIGRHRPTGLLTWLARGNWPAKIGGLLVLVGFGALLRYALLNVDIPDFAKLAGGVILSLVLGGLSMVVPEGPARRPLSLALGGAAFGVAYLTVYSAFALFGYLENPMGLGLLGLTSVAAAIYAVQRSALSLAVLSMAGAFLAPAFAIGDPGPEVVYGYYVGAGVLTLFMVILRGWRPLIHLSFLFTLAGSIFFAWTSRYFAAPYTDVMLVFLVVLTALHVAMPLLEKRAERLPWIETLDLVYLLALPVVAVVLAFFLAQNRMQFSTEIFFLAAIWALAAAALLAARREGVAGHAVIASLLAALAIAVRFRELPWELLLLAISVAALAIAAWKRKPVERLHGLLAGSVLLFAALHMLDALGDKATGAAFLNGSFAERIVGAALMITAGSICRRIRQPLDTLLLAMGILWAVLAIGVELVRIELATVALVVHWTLLLLAASLWIPGRKLHLADENAALLAIVIVLTAFWAAAGRPDFGIALASGGVASLALIGLAIRPVYVENDFAGVRALAAMAAPVAAALWAFAAAEAVDLRGVHPGLAAGTLVAVLALLAGRAMSGARGEWVEKIVGVFGVSFALGLAVETLADIARNPWAVGLELLCLAGLLVVTWIRTERQQTTETSTVACAIGLALILQANLLRYLGPPGDLNVSDVFEIGWPAVISLLWVAVACILTVWARRAGSRSLWIAGAMLLVVSAVKLLLYDFVSLGELANILAVIAAGGIFLLVGWLAPMPPAAEPAPSPPSAAARPRPEAAASGGAQALAEQPADSSRAVKTVAVLLGIAAVAYHFRHEIRELISDILFESVRRELPVSSAPPPPVTATVQAVSEPQPMELETEVYDLPGESEASRFEGISPSEPAAGGAGIRQLLDEGRIRPATGADLSRWQLAAGSGPTLLYNGRMDPYSGNRYVFRTYVVLREMHYPEGLHGGYAVNFLVPSSVPMPQGDPGHSLVLAVP